MLYILYFDFQAIVGKPIWYVSNNFWSIDNWIHIFDHCQIEKTIDSIFLHPFWNHFFIQWLMGEYIFYVSFIYCVSNDQMRILGCWWIKLMNL